MNRASTGNNLLFDAVVKGFLEGIESVACVVGPLAFFGLVCWQLAVALLVVAVVVGAARAVQRAAAAKAAAASANPTAQIKPQPKAVATQPKDSSNFGIELFSRHSSIKKPPQPRF